MQNPTERPAESLDSISPGLAAQEQARQDALLTVRRLRKEASAEIERLIAFMDETDGYTGNELESDDADFEDDGGGEPSLGSFDGLLNQTKAWRTPLVSADADTELDDCDREPSLATPEDMNGSQDQRLWEYGCRKDLEDDAGSNPELDPGESGIADLDGMREQWAGSPWLPVGEAVL